MPDVVVPGTTIYVRYPDNWSQDQISQDLQQKQVPFYSKMNAADRSRIGDPYSPLAPPAPPATSGGLGQNLEELAENVPASALSTLTGMGAGLARLGTDVLPSSLPGYGLLGGIQQTLGGWTKGLEQWQGQHQTLGGKAGSFLGMAAPAVAAETLTGGGATPLLAGLAATTGYGLQSYGQERQEQEDYEKRTGTTIPAATKAISSVVPAIVGGIVSHYIAAGGPEVAKGWASLFSKSVPAEEKLSLLQNLTRTGVAALRSSTAATAYGATSTLGQALYDPNVQKALGMSGTAEEREKNLSQTMGQYGMQVLENLPGALLTMGFTEIPEMRRYGREFDKQAELRQQQEAQQAQAAAATQGQTAEAAQQQQAADFTAAAREKTEASEARIAAERQAAAQRMADYTAAAQEKREHSDDTVLAGLRQRDEEQADALERTLRSEAQYRQLTPDEENFLKLRGWTDEDLNGPWFKPQTPPESEAPPLPGRSPEDVQWMLDYMSRNVPKPPPGGGGTPIGPNAPVEKATGDVVEPGGQWSDPQKGDPTAPGAQALPDVAQEIKDVTAGSVNGNGRPSNPATAVVSPQQQADAKPQVLNGLATHAPINPASPAVNTFANGIIEGARQLGHELPETNNPEPVIDIAPNGKSVTLPTSEVLASLDDPSRVDENSKSVNAGLIQRSVITMLHGDPDNPTEQEANIAHNVAAEAGLIGMNEDPVPDRTNGVAKETAALAASPEEPPAPPAEEAPAKRKPGRPRKKVSERQGALFGVARADDIDDAQRIVSLLNERGIDAEVQHLPARPPVWKEPAIIVVAHDEDYNAARTAVREYREENPSKFLPEPFRVKSNLNPRLVEQLSDPSSEWYRMLDRLRISKILQLRLTDYLFTTAGQSAAGKYDLDNGFPYIALALDHFKPDTPASEIQRQMTPYLVHEVVHFLEDSGLLTGRQSRTLLSKSKTARYQNPVEGHLTPYDLAVSHYAPQADALKLDERQRQRLYEKEAIAYYMQDMAAGNLPHTVTFDTAWSGIDGFLRALKRVLTGQSFDTAEQIYNKFQTGELTKRRDINAQRILARLQTNGQYANRNPYPDFGSQARKDRFKQLGFPEGALLQIDPRDSPGWALYLENPELAKSELERIMQESYDYANNYTRNPNMRRPKNAKPDWAPPGGMDLLREKTGIDPRNSLTAERAHRLMKGPSPYRVFYESMKNMKNHVDFSTFNNDTTKGERELDIFPQLLAATSAQKTPRENLSDAISIWSNWLRGERILPRMINNEPVRDVLWNGGNDTAKMQSFAEDLGMHMFEDPANRPLPMITNDMWEATLFGLLNPKTGKPDNTLFERYEGAMTLFSQRFHELFAKAHNDALRRLHGNNMPPEMYWLPWQVQSMMWHNLREESGQQVVLNDNYVGHMPELLDKLQAAGVPLQIQRDRLGNVLSRRITRETLTDPRTLGVLSPKVANWARAPQIALEIRGDDKLHKEADYLARITRGVKTADGRDLGAALASAQDRWLGAKSSREAIRALLSKLYRDLGGKGITDADWTRMEVGRGTFQGKGETEPKVASNLQIPLHPVDVSTPQGQEHLENLLDAFASASGHLWNQEGVGFHTFLHGLDENGQLDTLFPFAKNVTDQQFKQMADAVGHNGHLFETGDGHVVGFFPDKNGEYPDSDLVDRVAQRVLGDDYVGLTPIHTKEPYTGYRAQEDYLRSTALALAAENRGYTGKPEARVKRYLHDAGLETGFTKVREDYRNELRSLVDEAKQLGYRVREPVSGPRYSSGWRSPWFKHDDWHGPQFSVRRPNYEVRRVADEYKAENGITKPPLSDEVPVSVPLLKRVADVYDRAPHMPDDPETQMSYRALADETGRQFRKMNIKAEPWTQGGQPYKNSEEMLDDVQHNKHLWYFPTEMGFGPEGSESFKHPMLDPTEERDSSGRKLIVNDLFRIVHDYFGHGQSGHSFGPKGELNAFLDHARMYSDDAVPALAAETLGQNSWFNYGPHMRRTDGTVPERGDPDWVPMEDRSYADQKAFAMPQNVLRQVEDYANGRPQYSFLRSFHSTTPPQAQDTIGKRIHFQDDDQGPGWFSRLLKPDFWRETGAKVYKGAVTGARYAGKIQEKQLGRAPTARESVQKAIEDVGHIRPLALNLFDAHGGAPVDDNGYVHSNGMGGFLGAVKDVLKNGLYREYSFWHAMKRAQNINQIANGPRLALKPEELAEFQRLDQQHGQTFNSVYNKINLINKAYLDFAMKHGLMDQKAYAKFLQYGDYVPLKGAIEDESDFGLGGASQLANLSNVLNEKFRGGDYRIEDPLRMMLDNHYQILNTAIRNRAAVRTRDLLLHTVDQNGNPLLAPVKPNYIPHGKEQKFSIWEDGKRAFYSTTDPESFDLFRHIEQIAQVDPALNKWLGFFTRALRFGATKNPAFAVANIIRDIVDARMLSGAQFNMVTEPLRALAASLGAKNEYTPILEKLREAGIAGDHTIVMPHDPVQAAQRRLEFEGAIPQQGWDAIKTKLMKGFDAYERKLDATDQVSRMLVYKHVLERTGDEAQALHEANMVMPFNRHGSHGILSLLRVTVPFINSRIQGLDVVGRSLTGKAGGSAATGRIDLQKGRLDAGQLRRRALMNAAGMAAATIAYSAMSSGQPYYENSSDDIRDNYWLLPVGNGHALKIPTPFEFGLLFKTIPERIYRAMVGKDAPGSVVPDIMRQVGSTLAFNPLPQAVKPAVEAIANYDFQTGRPVVDPYLQALQPDYRYRPSTSLLARFGAQDVINPIARAMNAPQVSPVQLDKLATGYGGTTALYLMQAVDALARHTGLAPQQPAMHMVDYPMMSHFFSRPDGGQLMGQFYAMQNTLEQALATMKKVPPEQRQAYYLRNKNLLQSAQFIERLGQNLKNLREQERAVQGSPSLSPDAKRKSLDDLRAVEIRMLQPLPLLQRFAATGQQ